MIESSKSLKERSPPFPFAQEIEECYGTINKMISRELRELSCSVLSTNNMLAFSHGKIWKNSWPSAPDDQGEMEDHSVEAIIPVEDIVRNDLQLIDRFVNRFVRGINDQFMQNMYSKISDTADKAGNVVSGKDYESFAETFLESIKRLEFSVGDDGEVSLPQLHVTPELFEKMRKDLLGQGSEFESEVAKITSEKIQAAKDREAERLEKFLDPGELQ